MKIENVVNICVALDIAILGMAYPIIINNISTIGSKYSSVYIPVLFNLEFPQKKVKVPLINKDLSITYFELFIYITLVSFIFLIFPLEPKKGWSNVIVDNSADLLAIISSFLLVIFFINWLRKVYLYAGNTVFLLNYLTNEYDLNKDSNQEYYTIKAINEISIYSVNVKDEYLQNKLVLFYGELIQSIDARQNDNLPLELIKDVYFVFNKINKIVANNEKL